MRVNEKWLVFLTCIVLMPGIQNSAQGGARVNTPVVAWLEPEGPITKNAPLTIHLTYALDPLFNNMVTTDTGSFSVGFTSPEENGRQTYPVKYERTSAFLDIMGKVSPGFPTRRTEKTSLSYSGTFQIVIPDTTISCFSLEMHCGKGKTTLRYFFIEADDTIGFYGNLPIDPRILHKYDVVSTESRGREINRDTLTEGQLETKYKVLLDLKDPNHRAIAEKILGQMQEKNKSDICPTCYALDVSLRNLFKLADAGLEIGFFNPPPWSPEYKIAPPENKQPDSNVDDEQGVIFNKSYEAI